MFCIYKLTVNFFLGDKSRRVQSVDSHNRLFGDVNRLQTPAKNHMKSSIPFGNGTNNHTDMVDANGHNGTNGKINGHDHHTNGHGHKMNEKSHMNGNGIAHANGHSENGINKGRCFFLLNLLFSLKKEKNSYTHTDD